MPTTKRSPELTPIEPYLGHSYRPEKKHVFAKQLSKQSIGIYMQLCREANRQRVLDDAAIGLNGKESALFVGAVRIKMRPLNPVAKDSAMFRVWHPSFNCRL